MTMVFDPLDSRARTINLLKNYQGRVPKRDWVRQVFEYGNLSVGDVIVSKPGYIVNDELSVLVLRRIVVLDSGRRYLIVAFPGEENEYVTTLVPSNFSLVTNAIHLAIAKTKEARRKSAGKK